MLDSTRIVTTMVESGTSLAYNYTVRFILLQNAAGNPRQAKAHHRYTYTNFHPLPKRVTIARFFRSHKKNILDQRLIKQTQCGRMITLALMKLRSLLTLVYANAVSPGSCEQWRSTTGSCHLTTTPNNVSSSLRLAQH